jgi:rhodanese-related sulfurtransferase
MIRSSRFSSRLAAIALSLAALVSCARGAAETSISQADLADRIGANSAPLILDVRTVSEFDSGHIPGAVNIPHTELLRRIGELEANGDQEVVVYCERGGRAKAAEAALREAGFSTVRHLEGDMSAWRESPHPCVGC